eukprot:1188221-Prorocentrum_minimum.AAC.1
MAGIRLENPHGSWGGGGVRCKIKQAGKVRQTAASTNFLWQASHTSTDIPHPDQSRRTSRCRCTAGTTRTRRWLRCHWRTPERRWPFLGTFWGGPPSTPGTSWTETSTTCCKYISGTEIIFLHFLLLNSTGRPPRAPADAAAGGGDNWQPAAAAAGGGARLACPVTVVRASCPHRGAPALGLDTDMRRPSNNDGRTEFSSDKGWPPDAEDDRDRQAYLDNRLAEPRQPAERAASWRTPTAKRALQLAESTAPVGTAPTARVDGGQNENENEIGSNKNNNDNYRRHRNCDADDVDCENGRREIARNFDAVNENGRYENKTGRPASPQGGRELLLRGGYWVNPLPPLLPPLQGPPKSGNKG